MPEANPLLPKAVEGAGGVLANRKVLVSLVPALVFWAGGLATWLSCSAVSSCGHYSALLTTLTTIAAQAPSSGSLSISGGTLLIALGIGMLLLVFVSGALVQGLTLPVLQTLEGYWPYIAGVGRFREWAIEIATGDVSKDGDRLSSLETIPLADRTQEQLREYSALEERLRRLPSTPNLRMPTRLGNILRASETRPQDKYGLVATICWTRLWLVLPQEVRREIAGARATLDTCVVAWMWSLLFVVWSVWELWAALLGVVGAWLIYSVGLCGAARTYGDLVEAAFDIHRIALYRALRWPSPVNPAHERTEGQRLTNYLWRGSDDPLPVFTKPGATDVPPVPVAAGQLLQQAEQLLSATRVHHLAERLVARPQVGQLETIELLPGQLPVSFDAALVPPNSSIVGSAVHRLDGSFEFDAVLDVPDKPDAVLSFFRKKLPEKGWQLLPPNNPSGGFQPPPTPIQTVSLQDTDGRVLWVTIAPVGNDMSDVRLRVETHAASASRPVDLSTNSIPTLQVPEGTKLWVSSSTSQASWHASQAAVMTDTAVQELQEHFATQLQKAGWVRQSGGSEASSAWTTWQVPVDADGETHRHGLGLLYVLAMPDKHVRFLCVETIGEVPDG